MSNVGCLFVEGLVWWFVVTPLPLALPLFVPRVCTNNADHAFAPDDLAVLAEFFH
jgi:hypothetical protein